MRFLIVVLILVWLLAGGVRFTHDPVWANHLIDNSLYMLPALIVVLVLLRVVSGQFKNSGRRSFPRRGERAKEDCEEEMRDINSMLARMEDRIESLETILFDRETRARTRRDDIGA